MHRTTLFPRRRIQTGDDRVVAHVGAHVLGTVADHVGLTAELTKALAPLKQRRRGHDRGAVLAQLAVAIADGATTLSDLAILRHQPDLFGSVASTATLWHTEGLEGSEAGSDGRLRSAACSLQRFSGPGSPARTTFPLPFGRRGPRETPTGRTGLPRSGHHPTSRPRRPLERPKRVLTERFGLTDQARDRNLVQCCLVRDESVLVARVCTRPFRVCCAKPPTSRAGGIDAGARSRVPIRPPRFLRVRSVLATAAHLYAATPCSCTAWPGASFGIREVHPAFKIRTHENRVRDDSPRPRSDETPYRYVHTECA